MAGQPAGGVLDYLNNTSTQLQITFHRIPGSALLIRYIKASYQDDPIRSVIELCLVVFVIRYFLSSKYSTENTNYVKLTEEEIDELVDEWQPEELVVAPTTDEQLEIDKIPVIVGPIGPKVKLTSGKTVTHLASYNFMNFVSSESICEKAITTLRNYGVGACGPPGFYGTLDVHMKLERDLANFLGVSDAIIYAQAFSTISSVIPAFAKRGDIIVAEKGCNFAIQKGLQISRSTIHWFEHNSISDLERVLENIRVQQLVKRKPLTRMFIICEGLSENYGDIIDLPKVVELKKKYKYRLILDDTWGFGVLGKTGRGVTEHTGVIPSEVDMIVGSMANTLVGGGGFCAGSAEVVDHQRISGAAFVFSAALPAMLAVTASEAIALLSAPTAVDGFSQLRENTRAFRVGIEKSDILWTPSDPESPIIHLRIKPQLCEKYGLTQHDQDRVLQEIVDEALQKDVLLTRARHIHHQEAHPNQPSIRVCVTAGHNKKDVEKAAGVVKGAASKVLPKRK
ncbi:PLP-dependent transferase [Saitoella complicata NRRL Y-17804]|uniref:serine C-palmitoyltransferase n=1 Tax=Saitoella complicata (strain BCRC 22490 / CBS 7301 / JCM 7358 / NBRC 10748 / NRRL Y-17804) TaxID=698492 RepID=A0A0E9NI71_SAICN|nr:PLP-dependent transferase [Saitoella complicata NRRL Y-17804]ODQ54041.1 PLP-dependent transferase [Saitoella complicata NRRL Y-17804]GAO49115.1 hypothetical protein G7K_3273-t1 [Saitoella complicata NRRL Y-17804]